MKNRKFRATTNQLDRLWADVHALPAEPVGDHLADDEFIGYTMETLTPEEVRRADVHLASCPECATEVERLLEGAEAWRGEHGKQRLAALRQRVLGTSMLRERLANQLPGLFSFPRVALAGAWAATREVVDGQTADGALRWFIKEDEARNLIVRFDSDALELDGLCLRLRAGDWRRDVVLEGVTADEVGVEIKITHDEREDLPADAVLRVEIILQDPSASEIG